MLVEEWNKSRNPDDRTLFRPYVAGSTDKANDTGSVTNTDDENVPFIRGKQTMLFVHQFHWQRRLLNRYGQDICLLDATYKTCKYALPLFFLCVKTNVNYQVVASFIVQNETENDILEAFQILKSWNPFWFPSFFMTDKCDAEINAIESAFPG